MPQLLEILLYYCMTLTYCLLTETDGFFLNNAGAFPTSPPGPKRKEQKKRKTWSMIEVQAVERHMKDFITLCRVPGKTPCENCIRAEPLALKNRDWQSVKFYVYNRIMAQKRDGTHKV